MEFELELNDKVIIKSDIDKIIYVIDKIIENKIYIKGLNYRLRKIVNADEIKKATYEEIQLEENKCKKYFINVTSKGVRQSKRYILGKVLHIDGDDTYLSKCLELYKALGVFAYGAMIKEDEMPDKIVNLIYEVNPDIIVITGHDLYNGKGKKDLNNYSNTKYFIKTIKEIRKIKSDYCCSIIAGACQSNFEALIASGANFASSPGRINVHTFDPAVLAIRIASTSFLKIVSLDDALKFIENGRRAFGGIETLGKMRLML